MNVASRKYGVQKSRPPNGLETISEIVGRDWRDGAAVKGACCSFKMTRIGILVPR